MMKDEILSKLMKTEAVRNLGLREEAVVSILQSYDQILIDELLKHGYLELPNGINIEIVKLIDRIHVLRGIAYPSTRKYKLKSVMREELYDKVDNYYTRLERDIL